MHNVWSREGYWYKYLHPHFSTCHLLLTTGELASSHNAAPMREAEPGVDPFLKLRADKKETLHLAAISVPITGTKQPSIRLSKEVVGQAAGLASTATASNGKFDKKLPGEKPPKFAGKHQKAVSMHNVEEGNRAQQNQGGKKRKQSSRETHP
ncbi:unnamed protein product [Sphagnum balticum]